MSKTRSGTRASRGRTASPPAGAARPPDLTAAADAADAGGLPLVRFDRKTKGLLGALIVLLALGTLTRIHGSSIGLWNRKSHDRPADAGVLLGTPKVIRSDEWYFSTPMIVSQASARPAFPTVNAGWGPAAVPLVARMPARHWSMLFRPRFWGFFVLDLEHGFAFFWNMKAVALIGGVFLLLMVLTANDFGLSLLGAAWIYWSGFIQWWYSSDSMLPEMLGAAALLVVALHYVAFARRRWTIAGAAAVGAACLVDFVLCFYPPFQVPLAYLVAAVTVSSIGPRLRTIGSDAWFRAACGAAMLTLAGLALALYYGDAKQAIDVMRGTVYPGTRLSTGGDTTVAQLFSGIYGFFMTEDSFPQRWGNVCEASSFALLFPIPALAILQRAWRRRSVSGVEWGLLAYIALVLAWLTLGWPRPLAIASGFALTHDTRPLVGLGPASILLCCVYLQHKRPDLPDRVAGRIAIAALVAAAVLLFSVGFNLETDGFATPARMLLVTSMTAGAGFFLLARWRAAFAACVLAPSIWSFGLVNPVAAGLQPITGMKAFTVVSDLVGRDPAGRWAVYGDASFANLFKAAGANVVNGTKYVPPLDDLRVLDPQASFAPIYNRYAQIELTARPGAQVLFALIHPDLYTIAIDPRSDLWPRLGVRYLALPFQTGDRAVLGPLTPVAALPDIGLWIYRRAPASSP